MRSAYSSIQIQVIPNDLKRKDKDEYAEAISDESNRSAMATSHPSTAQTEMASGGRGRPPRDCVSDQNRVTMANAAQSLWVLAKCVWVFQHLERKRHLAANPASPASERQRQGRKSTASAGSIDSQSIKTATQGESKGYDAGKMVNGRKRHLLVDTLGLIVCVFVSLAN